MATITDTRLHFTQALDACTLATPDGDEIVRKALFDTKRIWVAGALTFVDLAKLRAVAANYHRDDILAAIDRMHFRSVRRRA